jgi:glutathione S-transferase
VDPEKLPKNMPKSFSGKLPFIELEDGKTCLTEPLSIAKFFSSNKYNFYGPDEIERAQVDQ